MKYLLLIFFSFCIISCYGNSNTDLLIHIKNEKDTAIYNYKEFTDSILVGALNDVMIAERDLLNCKEAQVGLQQKIIISLVFGVVGVISFFAFIVFLILYIILRRKTSKLVVSQFAPGEE